MSQRFAVLVFAASFAAACGSNAPTGTEEDITTVDVVDDTIAVPDLGGLDVEEVGEDVRPDIAVCDGLGCPCTEDVECASGYCLDIPGGGSACSEFCTDRCSQPGYECVYLENSGGDAVRLCVPANDPFCEECAVRSDCGSLRAACFPLDDGNWCLTPCSADERCRQGATCTTVTVADTDRRLCVPDDNVCTPCIDEDGDLYGLGMDCLGFDPNDQNPNVYPGAPELCDNLDNDGNGAVDEGFDLLSDPAHCGACGVVCSAQYGEAACQNGECVIVACDDGWGDCNNMADDGCEADLSDPNRCGECAPAAGTLGEACGTCDAGVFVCEDGVGLVCEGDPGDEALNACGGCTPIDETPGAACGTCDLGTWQCNEDGSAVVCVDDPGTGAINACGGCATLAAAPGDRCGTCGSGQQECDGVDAVMCVGDLGDAAPSSCASLGTLRFSPTDTPAQTTPRRSAITAHPMTPTGRSDLYWSRPQPNPSP